MRAIKTFFIVFSIGLHMSLSSQSLVENNRYPGEIIWTEVFNSEFWSSTVNNDSTVIENLPAG
ncbi:MAG TPA: hypothetical protein PK990_10825, partial [Salinivirgaceae bacterium]|nr:hypothetical protein [Salinivirgaceae bacterium]